VARSGLRGATSPKLGFSPPFRRPLAPPIYGTSHTPLEPPFRKKFGSVANSPQAPSPAIAMERLHKSSPGLGSRAIQKRPLSCRVRQCPQNWAHFGFHLSGRPRYELFFFWHTARWSQFGFSQLGAQKARPQTHVCRRFCFSGKTCSCFPKFFSEPSRASGPKKFSFKLNREEQSAIGPRPAPYTRGR